ncbi:MAG: Type secretion system protein TssA [Massilia sp.]|nr:Type secretion system protein TssA [Massilia sp.]
MGCPVSKLDVDTLLREIDPAAPCGPNLEYDPLFVELDQEVLGKPEVQYGATVTAAMPPDWKAVRRMATDLFGRSRDLRLAVHLMRANLALFGTDGLADGLHLVERLLEERWDSVHPQLDADDDMDPMLRINSLAILADLGTVLKDLKEATLVVLPGLGPLSLRTLEISSGELPTPVGEVKIVPASIEKSLADLDETSLGRSVDILTRALGSVVNIESLLVRRVGSSQALNLDALTRPLKRGRDFLGQQLAARQAGREPVADETDTGGAGRPGANTGGQQRGASTGDSGEIANRADVMRMLDKLIKYYQQHEPSSPLPLLLERARRLAPKSFIEVMEDLAPDGLAQLKVIKGPDEAKKG